MFSELTERLNITNFLMHHSPKQIENTYNERMSNHRNLVDAFYHKITGKHCYQHDIDKDDNPIWKFYYYCRENKLDLPTQLKYEWMFADKVHKLNSSHHIECLTNNIELDWDELVADFFLQLIISIILKKNKC